MGLLQEIQTELLSTDSAIGPTLLKLRYLAAQLGSGLLEEWVKYETEGYPVDLPLPEYRMASVSYSGTFTNGYTTLNNVPIPSHLVETHAGKGWVQFEIRDSIAVIDSIIKSADGDKIHNFGVSAGNLILLLQGKVYEGHSLISISSQFGGSPFAAIHNIVRARILDLTLQLEKTVPVSSLIEVGMIGGQVSPANTAHTTMITQTIVYGNQNNISAPQGVITFNVIKGDTSSLTGWLTGSGIPEEEAKELAELAASEQPESPEKPFGAKVGTWILDKLSKGAAGAFEVGKDVAKDVIIAGLKGYYGLA
jgi:hypothetical protein